MAESRPAVEVRAQRAPTPLIRPGTAADIRALRALGEAVVPPTCGPVGAAYARRMLDGWWVPDVFEKSLTRRLHVHPDHHGRGVGGRLLAGVEAMVHGDEWPDTIRMRKKLR